jgi:hypothetical protein
VRYDARTYRLLPLDDVTLNTLHGRVVCRMQPGAHQRALLLEDGWTIASAELVQRRGCWSLHIVQHASAPTERDPTGYLGVDLGIATIATDSTGQSFTGDAIKKTRERCPMHHHLPDQGPLAAPPAVAAAPLQARPRCL